MVKEIKKYISYILFLMVVLFSSISLNAAENPVKNSSATSEQTEIESSMNDLSHRLILSMFGKQALTWFDVEGSIDYTISMNENEEIYYAKPFNKNNFNLFKSFLIISLVIGTFIFSVYLFWIAKEGLFKTQSSGSFLGDEWNPIFTFAKIGIVTILLFPAFLPYNTSHMLFFKMLGYSNVIAKEITTTIVENQPRAFFSIKYPSSSARKEFGEDLINFMTCAKEQRQLRDLDSTSLSLHFDYEEGEYSAVSRYEDCMLSVDFAIDRNTSRIILENKDIKDTLNLTNSFEKVQENVMKNMLLKALKSADKVSSNLMTIPVADNLTDVTFDKYKNANGDRVMQRNWEGSCDSIINLDSVSVWSNIDRSEYIYLASRCISYDIVKDLTYPRANVDFAKYLKNDNYLKDNQIDLCSHDFSGNDIVKAKAMISETNNMTLDGLINLANNSNSNINVKEKSAKDCLLSECSMLESSQSNIYTCSNVVHMYNQVNKLKTENGKIQSTGFLTLGSYMYTMFDNGQLNMDSKILLNSLRSSYENDTFFPLGTNKRADGLSVDFSITPVSVDEKQASAAKALGDFSVITSYKDVFEKRKNEDTAIAGLTNFGNGAYVDFLGFVRFNTCLQYPLQIEKGYSCGSIPTEMHYMGRNLFEFAVDAKIMMHTYQAIYQTSNVMSRYAKEASIEDKKDSKNKGDNKKDVKGKSKSKLANKVISPLILALPIMGDVFEKLQSSFVYDLVSVVKPAPDEFGSLTTEKIENQKIDLEKLTANGIALLAVAGGDSIVGEFFNLMINFIMLMGLVFGYILPLIPLYLWFVVIMGWLMLVIVTISILPIWVPTIATPNNDSSSKAERAGMLLLLKLFLKAPLLCLGVLVAWILTNTVVSRISGYMNIDKMFSMEQGNSFISTLDTLIIGLVYCVFLWYIINLTITVMETFYEFSTSWLSNSGGNSMFGRDVSSGFLRAGSTQTNTIKKLNPLKTKFRKR